MKYFMKGFLILLFGLFVLRGNASADSALELLKDIEVHGFVSTSYNYNFHNPATPTTGNTSNRIFDQDSNSFKFDVGELVFVKETPDVGDVGFRTDLDFGSSVPNTVSGRGATDDFDIQQGYVSYNAPIGSGLQIDMGKFITHIGAEVIEGHDGWNYNYSRSFLFGLAIPFVHTGIRAGYNLTNEISIMGMIANGFGTDVDTNNDKTIGFQLGIAPSDNISFLLNWAGGNVNAGTVNNNNYRSVWDLVLDVGLTDRLLFQLNIDYGTQDAISTVVANGDATWWGIAGILRHDCSDSFSMNLRAEFFGDDDGTQSSVGSVNNRTSGQHLWEFTITPEFRINQNLIFRVEYRHDESTRFAFNDENNNQLNSSQDTIAANALFYF